MIPSRLMLAADHPAGPGWARCFRSRRRAAEEGALTEAELLKSLMESAKGDIAAKQTPHSNTFFGARE